MGGKRGELADSASLIIYCKGKHSDLYLQEYDEEMHVKPGQFVIRVESPARRIDNKCLIKELEQRLPMSYPQVYIDRGHDYESYHGESTDFDYKELVSALKAMAREEFTEEVAPPKPRHHATKAVLRKEIMKLLGLTKAQVDTEDFEDDKLHLSADLDEDESDLENEKYVYHRFRLLLGDTDIKIDKYIYKNLMGYGTWNGEYQGDEFYNISLSRVLDALE